MQATGKFYVLTVLGYVALFVGSIIVTLTSGIVVTSTIGIAIGEHIFSSAALIFSSDCVGNIGIVISSVGNGEPYSDIFLYAEI